MVMGLPAHPLLVHFAIVLLLLAAGAQVLAVAVPRFRRWFDWGMPLLAVAGAVSGRVAQSYGEILMARREGTRRSSSTSSGELRRGWRAWRSAA